MNRTHSRRFARSGDARRSRSVWSACVFSAAFPKQAPIRWPGWFIESPLSFFRMHWDHEPRAVPRLTKSADESDALQTPRAIRRRPAVAKRLECVRLQRRFPKPGSDSMAGLVHREPPFVFFRMHWDHEPYGDAQLVRCPAFRRSEPAKARTPNSRFMESLPRF